VGVGGGGLGSFCQFQDKSTIRFSNGLSVIENGPFGPFGPPNIF
jgi:hypothetical protein